MTAKALEWRYFVSRANDGDVLEIVRRSFDGVTYGPFVQALTPGSEWVDRPQILHAFQDPGWYVPVSEAEARSAAAETGGAFPADEPTDEEEHAAMVAAFARDPRARIVPATSQAWPLTSQQLAAVKKQLGR